MKLPPIEKALAAADHVFEWCEAHRDEAELLLRYRRDDLIRGDMPKGLAQRAKRLNEPAAKMLNELAKALSPSSPDLERVRFACVTVPVAAVREALVSDQPLSRSARKLVAETVRSLLKPR